MDELTSTAPKTFPERIWIAPASPPLFSRSPAPFTSGAYSVETYDHEPVHVCETVLYIRADKAPQYKPIEEMPDELKKDGARFIVPNCTVKSPITGWKAEEPIIVQMRFGVMYFDNSLSHEITGVTHYLDISLLPTLDGEEN